MSEIKPYPVDPSYQQVKKPIVNQVDTSIYNIVKATQYGIYSRCVELIENGQDVNEMDSENVSLLHWAAINNRSEIVLYYLTKGADIDAIGGDLKSTPLHWAVRQQLLDMVALLMKNGANPGITDGEGNTCLHVAAQLAHTNIVAYFLATGMDINSLSTSGATPLMISATRLSGPDPMRLLITWGASINLGDNNGDTAGHYAARTNNFEAIRQLDKADIDWNAVNKDGYTVHQILKARKVFFLVDQLDSMMYERGVKRHRNFLVQSTLYNNKFRFISMVSIPPIAFLLCGIVLHFHFNYWLKLLALCIIIITFRSGSIPFMDSRVQLLTVFSLATCTTFFLCTTYIWLLIHFNCFFVNLTFILSITSLWYYFLKCCFCDPGYVKADKSKRDEAILSMADPNPSIRLSINRFCTTCLIKKPLRSKHCSVCNKCVAKFDHHCPWIYNCVGSKNHRLFIMYLVSLIPSLSLFAYGCFGYWNTIKYENTSLESKAIILYQYCINAAWSHPWLAYCFCNSLIYLIWVVILLFVQLYQLLVLNATTNERINWSRYSAAAAIPLPDKHNYSSIMTPEANNHHGHSHSNSQTNYPYKIGFFKHLSDFMGWRRFRIDWSNIFDMNEYHSFATKTKSGYEQV